ncbi:MAG: hypothetical protein H6862_01670 [Rhodospirillales bacterium]|nr:hypothetical protein [Rhodospirillales bacterium]
MSASGPTLFPPGGRFISPQPLSGEARPAEAISIPPAQDDERGRTRHLRGEVVGREDGGRVRIRTDRGEVQLRLGPRTPPLSDGQRVDIEIPPGDIPQKVFLRSLSVKSHESAPAAPPQDTVSTSKPLPVLPPDLPSGAGQDAEIAESLPVRLVFLPPAQSVILNGAQASQGELDFFQKVLLPVFPALPVQSGFSSRLAPASLVPDLPDLLFPSLAKPLQTQITVETQSIAVFLPPHRLAAVIPGPEESLPKRALYETAPLRSISQPLPDLFSLLAQGGRFGIPLESRSLLPLKSPDISDTQAFSVPGHLDIHILKTDRIGLRITPPEPSSQKTHNAVFQVPSGTPGAILSGTVGVFSGQVVTSSGPGGLPVVSVLFPESPFSHLFTMHMAAPDLSEGVCFDFVFSRALQTGLTPSVSFAPDRLDVPASLWPAVNDVFQAFSALVPGAVPHGLAQSLAHILPNPGAPAQVGPAIVFFIAALRTGDFGGWVGEKTLDALRRAGKADALGRAERDFSALSEMAARQVDEGGWKSLPVPFLWENRVHRALLHHRAAQEEQEGSGGKKGGKSTRFVFDLMFNRLGDVQVDCLYRENRLDVALRTIAPLSAAMRQDLRTRFVQALAQAGIHGEIRFQSDPEFFLKIPARDKPRSAWV